MRSRCIVCAVFATSLVFLLPNKGDLGLIGQARAAGLTAEEKKAQAEERQRAKEEERRRAAEEAYRRAVIEARLKDADEKVRNMISSGDTKAAMEVIGKMERDVKLLGRTGVVNVGALKNQLNEACQAILAAADADYAAGRYKEALKQYTRISVNVSGLPAAKEALQKLQAAKNDPAVRTAEREAEAENRYSAVTAMIEADKKALAEKAKPNLGEQPADQPSDIDIVLKMTMPKKASILRTLDGLKSQYPDTEAGKEAIELLTQMQANEELIKAVNQWQSQDKVRQLFQKARTYETNNMPDKAIGFYEELLRDYPDSEYAEKAKARLAQLKKLTN